MTEEKREDKKPRQFLPGISPFRFVLWFFKWRNIQRILFVLVCMATLIAIFYAEENWRGRRAWEKYKREQEAKGEKLDWPSFYPPAIPDDQNFAMAPYWAAERHRWERENKSQQNLDEFDDSNPFSFGYTSLSIWRRILDDPGLTSWYLLKRAELKAWQEYYRFTGPWPRQPRLIITTNEFPIPPVAGEPAQDVLLALNKHKDSLEKLREAARRPMSRFPINYDEGFNMLLSHLAKIKGCEQFLLLHSSAELELGQNEQAFEDVGLMFRLTESVQSEPTMVSFFVRGECLSVALGGLWEGMALRRWSEPQLKATQERLEAMNMIAHYAQTVRAHRAASLALVDDLEAFRMKSRWAAVALPEMEAYYQKGAAGYVKEMEYRTFLRLAPRGWFERNKVGLSRGFEERLAVLHPESRSVDLKQLTTTITGEWPRNEFFRNSTLYHLPALDSLSAAEFAERAVRYQSSVNMGAVACALERYALANGKYPEKLDELAPQFITKIPREVASGQPLKYRRSDDGRFVLYSLGVTDKDSGGTYLDSKGKRTGNLVWRYPAK